MSYFTRARNHAEITDKYPVCFIEEYSSVPTLYGSAAEGHAFETTQDQIPLSPVVSSLCSAYFFRVWAFSPTYAGGVTVDLHGRLWLPFFYKNPPPGSPNWYGTWLPIEIEICSVSSIHNRLEVTKMYEAELAIAVIAATIIGGLA